MHWVHYALAILACYALLVSWNIPRCRLWVFALTASYIVSVAYYRIAPEAQAGGNWPHGAFVAFACDSILFVLIRETHSFKWEIRYLGSIIIASVTLNAAQMIGLVIGWPPMLSQDVYSSILEAANAAYLIVIGGVGTLEWIANAQNARHNLHGHRGGGMASVVHHANKKTNQKTTATQPLRRW